MRKIKNIYQPETDFQPILWISKADKKVYRPMLKIGVQTMHFGRECETVAEAVFYLKCMDAALRNFTSQRKPPVIKKRPQKSIQFEFLKMKKKKSKK